MAICTVIRLCATVSIPIIRQIVDEREIGELLHEIARRHIARIAQQFAHCRDRALAPACQRVFKHRREIGIIRRIRALVDSPCRGHFDGEPDEIGDPFLIGGIEILDAIFSCPNQMFEF